MSKSTAHTVCRLCGGSGLPQHPVVVARKPPALCTAFVRPSADVVVPMAAGGAAKERRICSGRPEEFPGV